MGKFVKASDEIQTLVDEVASELGLAQMGVNFHALCVGKASDVVTVQKASSVAEYYSKEDDLVLVVVFEEAFDKLGFDEEAQKSKYLWIRMALDTVSMDENGKILIDKKSTITLPIGFYDKFKGSAIDAALLGKYTIAQIEDERKAKKAAEKAAKAGKKKKGGFGTV